MRNIYRSAVLVVVILSCGCVTRTDFITSDHRHFPKNPQFTTKPATYDESCGLEFNSIYYNLEERANLKDTNVVCRTYNYYRFWPNGRVMLDFARELPSSTEVEEFSRAYIGYYQVTNGFVITELFSPNPGMGRWDYAFLEGAIRTNGIYFIVETFQTPSKLTKVSTAISCILEGVRGDTKRAYYILPYLKYRVGELKRQPDW